MTKASSSVPKRKYVKKNSVKSKKTAVNIIVPPIKEIEELSSDEEIEEHPISINKKQEQEEEEEEIDDDDDDDDSVVEVIKQVPVEVIKEVIVEVIKEVIVEVPVEVIKEVIVEVPVEVIKEVIVEVIKEVIVEVPSKPKELFSMKLSKFYACMSIVKGELTLHYVGTEEKCEKYKTKKHHAFVMQCKESIKLV
jgi:hypothetical protein